MTAELGEGVFGDQAACLHWLSSFAIHIIFNGFTLIIIRVIIVT